MYLTSKFLQNFRARGPVVALQFLGHWLNEQYHERRLGVRTAGFVPLSELGLTDFQQQCYAYEPITYQSIFQALAALSLEPGHDVFIDYGCGLGRALVAAATHPFKRVIGVELSPELAAEARRNGERAAHRLRCREIDVVAIDATRFEPPDDVTVVLLNNPFSPDLTRVVLDKLMASQRRVPRRLTLIYKYPEWSSDPIQEHPAFALRLEQRSYSEVGERLRIYVSEPAPTVAAAP